MTTTPPAPESTGPPRRAVARRRRWPKVVLAVGIALVLMIGGLAVYAYTLSNRVTQNITRGVDLPGDPSETPRPVNETGTLNYVLLGSDSRDPDRQPTLLRQAGTTSPRRGGRCWSSVRVEQALRPIRCRQSFSTSTAP